MTVTIESPTYYETWKSHPDLEKMGELITAGKYTKIEALGIAVAFLDRALMDIASDPGGVPHVALVNAEAETLASLGWAYDAWHKKAEVT